MRRSLALPLAVAALAFPLFAPADPPPPGDAHACPLCGSGVEIPDTPAGAFLKTKFALLAQDMDLLRECVLGLDGTETRPPGALERGLLAQLVKVNEKGDSAILVVQTGEALADLSAVRHEGRWKLDLRQIRAAREAEAGRAILLELGTRLRRYRTTRGKAPSPGEEFWSDMKAAGLLDLRLLWSTRAPLRPEEADLTAEDWSRVSWRVTRDALDGDLPPAKPVLWEKEGVAGRRLVLTAGGVVLDLTQEEFDLRIELHEGVPPAGGR